LVWKFAEHLQGRLHGDDVAIKTQSANDGSRSTRQYRVPVPFVAGVYVGYVKFDNGFSKIFIASMIAIDVKEYPAGLMMRASALSRPD